METLQSIDLALQTTSLKALFVIPYQPHAEAPHFYRETR